MCTHIYVCVWTYVWIARERQLWPQAIFMLPNGACWSVDIYSFAFGGVCWTRPSPDKGRKTDTRTDWGRLPPAAPLPRAAVGTMKYHNIWWPFAHRGPQCNSNDISGSPWQQEEGGWQHLIASFSGGGAVAARLRIRAVEAGWRDEEGKFGGKRKIFFLLHFNNWLKCSKKKNWRSRAEQECCRVRWGLNQAAVVTLSVAVHNGNNINSRSVCRQTKR